MKTMKIMAFILLSFSYANAADNIVSASFAGRDEVNDITYSKIKDFPTKWQLVTIRFRKDTGELRLTYANDSALKTLMSGSINYPDGAMFAKTNVHTELDKQYPNSIGPKEISRYQVMVKNKSKYTTTNGWGYALFDSNGKTFNEDPKQMLNACYSCHLAVENRGDVFSRPFSFIEKIKMPAYREPMSEFFKYKWIEKKLLPEAIANYLPKDVSKIRELDNKKLQDNVFQGTLDELKPLLQDESDRTNAPVVFRASDNHRFVMINQGKDNKCTDFLAYEIYSTDLSFNVQKKVVCKYD